MKPVYLHLPPEQLAQDIVARPFRAIMIADVAVSEAWRNQIAEWLVQRGCLYFVAWGVDCEAWHDSVDWANLSAFDYADIPDDRFVMTSWHADEPLSDALWFAGNCASHPHVNLQETIIFHVSSTAQSAAILQAYRESQKSDDEV